MCVLVHGVCTYESDTFNLRWGWAAFDDAKKIKTIAWTKGLRARRSQELATTKFGPWQRSSTLLLTTTPLIPSR